MEEGKLLMDIVLGSMGFILMTLFIFWFTGVNKTQKEHEKKIQEGIIKQIITEKDNRIQDKELAENKKANQKAKGEFYKNADKLASSLQVLTESQQDNHALIKENLVLIKQNMHRIETLEDRTEVFIKEIIKK
tara:strand:- start:3823 stop:4221 length:399 start_codon:yes stop_codon:yes gene_type:complete